MPSHVNLTPVQEEPLASQLPRLCSRELLRSSVEPTPNNIQYFYKESFLNDGSDPGSWHQDPPLPSPNNSPWDSQNKVRDGLGSTHHEAGTLWMGSDAATSVTNSDGRFHHLNNVYV